MNNMLAIETSGASCSVCLLVDGNRFSRCEHVDKRHNELLLPMLHAVRQEAGFSEREFLAQLDAVAFGRGPGSFTGVRIAAAAVQAIAMASGSSVLRVSSSAALAERALQLEPDAPGIVTLIRSRRDHYYLAAYVPESGHPHCVLADFLSDRSPPESWYPEYETWFAVGETPEWWQGREVTAATANAEQVIDVALRMLARGEQVDAAEGLPEYLEGDSPWKKN